MTSTAVGKLLDDFFFDAFFDFLGEEGLESFRGDSSEIFVNLELIDDDFFLIGWILTLTPHGAS